MVFNHRRDKMKQLLQDIKTGKTEIANVPAPSPTEGQILVRVRASAVSSGTERMVVDFAKSSLLGKARRRPDLVRQVIRKVKRDGLLTAWNAAQGRLEQPMPLGYSCAGVVEKVGEAVDGYARGDKVVCAGAGYANHAEFVAVPENLCARLPTDSDINWEEAAFSTLGAIALQGFRLSNSKLGESVAVLGLGLLGQISAQIAKAAGCKVLGIDLVEERLKTARASGVDAIIRGNAESAGTEFTHGRGFDTVLITADSSSNDPIELATTLARDHGTIVVVGNVPLGVSRDAFFRKELTLKVSRSYGPGRYDPSYEEAGIDYPFSFVRWTEQRNLGEFVRLLSTGLLDLGPIITHRLPISSGEKAYGLISESNPNTLGVVLNYPENAPKNSTIQIKENEIGALGDGIGVLGAGSFATGMMLPLLKNSGASLRGIASPSGTHAKSAANSFGFSFASSNSREVIADEQMSTVVILTRHNLHANQVCDALLAGKNVFVEKPLCLSIEELRKIESTVNDTKGILGVGFNRRFAPMTQSLKNAFKNYSGPKAMQIRINAGELPKGHWVADPGQGGRLLGEGCHFIDWANYIVGSKPISVKAKVLDDKPGDQDWSLNICYSDGSTADILYTTLGAPEIGKERYEVHGGGISAVLEDFGRLEVFKNGGKHVSRKWFSVDKGHEQQWRAFYSSVRHGMPAPISWKEIYQTTLTTLIARDSLHKNCALEVHQ